MRDYLGQEETLERAVWEISMREENVSTETHVVGEGMREAQTPCHVLTSFQGDNVGMIVAKTYNGPIVLTFFS